MKERMVRWSIDLRFQSTERPDGFYGLKPKIPMRSKKNPEVKIDWDAYDAADRYAKQKQFQLEKTGQVR